LGPSFSSGRGKNRAELRGGGVCERGLESIIITWAKKNATETKGGGKKDSKRVSARRKKEGKKKTCCWKKRHTPGNEKKRSRRNKLSDYQTDIRIIKDQKEEKWGK